MGLEQNTYNSKLGSIRGDDYVCRIYMLKALGKLKHLTFDKHKHDFVDRHRPCICGIYQSAVLRQLVSFLTAAP